MFENIFCQKAGNASKILNRNVKSVESEKQPNVNLSNYSTTEFMYSDFNNMSSFFIFSQKKQFCEAHNAIPIHWCINTQLEVRQKNKCNKLKK